jgi:hypothetical protein
LYTGNNASKECAASGWESRPRIEEFNPDKEKKGTEIIIVGKEIYHLLQLNHFFPRSTYSTTNKIEAACYPPSKPYSATLHKTIIFIATM